MHTDIEREKQISRDAGGLIETLSIVPRSARWILPSLAAAFRGTDVSTIELKTRALVLLRVAAVDSSPYWRLQIHDQAPALGISEGELELVGSDEWETVPGFDPRERAAILWADRVARRLAKRDKSAYEAVQAHFSEDEIVELTLICSLAAMATRMTNALRVAPETDAGLAPSKAPAPDLSAWASRMFEDDLAAAWDDGHDG